MDWGCMMADGVEFCYRVKGGLNSARYGGILSVEFMRSLQYYNREVTDIVFQQDDNPKYTLKRATGWFRKYGMEVLDWQS